MGGDTDTGSAEERNLANLVVPVRDPAAHIGHLGGLGPFVKRGRQYTRSKSQVPTGAGWIPGRCRAGPGSRQAPFDAGPPSTDRFAGPPPSDRHRDERSRPRAVLGALTEWLLPRGAGNGRAGRAPGDIPQPRTEGNRIPGRRRPA